MNRGWSGVLIGTLLLLGCGSQTGRADIAAQERGDVANSAEARSSKSVRLALLEPSRASDAAALEGFLLVQGRCLYVTGRDGLGVKTTPAFLIPGARWDAQKSVLLAHGKSFSSGQRVALGGSTATNPALLTWVQKPDPSCDSSSVFVTGMIDALPRETGVDADRLSGRWTILEINGAPLKGYEDIRLNIRDGRIEATSQCVRWLWSYATPAQGSIVLTKLNPGDVCDRGRSPDEEVFEAILDEANTTNQREDGAIVIRGSGGDILARPI